MGTFCLVTGLPDGIILEYVRRIAAHFGTVEACHSLADIIGVHPPWASDALPLNDDGSPAAVNHAGPSPPTARHFWGAAVLEFATADAARAFSNYDAFAALSDAPDDCCAVVLAESRRTVVTAPNTAAVDPCVLLLPGDAALPHRDDIPELYAAVKMRCDKFVEETGVVGLVFESAEEALLACSLLVERCPGLRPQPAVDLRAAMPRAPDSDEDDEDDEDDGDDGDGSATAELHRREDVTILDAGEPPYPPRRAPALPPLREVEGWHVEQGAVAMAGASSLLLLVSHCVQQYVDDGLLKVDGRAATVDLPRLEAAMTEASRVGCGPEFYFWLKHRRRTWVAMERLGLSLHDLSEFAAQAPHGGLTAAQVLLLGREMLRTVRLLHTKGRLVHRAVCPEHFCVPADCELEATRVVGGLVSEPTSDDASFDDTESGKRSRSPCPGADVARLLSRSYAAPPVKLISFTHTVEYKHSKTAEIYGAWWASEAAMVGVSSGRRDDVEGVIHCMGSLLLGREYRDSRRRHAAMCQWARIHAKDRALRTAMRSAVPPPLATTTDPGRAALELARKRPWQPPPAAPSWLRELLQAASTSCDVGLSDSKAAVALAAAIDEATFQALCSSDASEVSAGSKQLWALAAGWNSPEP